VRRSVANRRGSVMVYTIGSGHVAAWYAAFLDNAGWRLGRVKGVSRAEVESILCAGLPDDGS